MEAAYGRMIENAEAQLPHDPHDHDLIVILIGGIYRPDNGYRPTPDQKLLYAKRLIVGSPYDADGWYEVVDIMERQGRPPQDGDGYVDNMIYYSGYDYATLLHTLRGRTFEIRKSEGRVNG